MDSKKLQSFVHNQFDVNAIPSLMDYIRIPNLSRNYDSEFLTNGLLQKACTHLSDWVLAQNIQNLKLDTLLESGRTPTLHITIDASTNNASNKSILMYGHYDKQPHMVGWVAPFHPTIPIIQDGKLYGRGGADDGYAIYTAILSIKALQEQKLEHPKIQILLEGDEESGSVDLPYFLNKLQDQIGQPDLIICLDSGAMDYERLWVTCSLRGVLSGVLTVKVLTEGVHSGDASGIVPSSFRLMRQLLDRIENSISGDMHKALWVEIPQDRYAQCFETAKICHKTVFGKYPFFGDCTSFEKSPVEAYLNRCWRPQLEVTGMDGIPTLDRAGNVLRPYTTAKLSIRLPPTQSKEVASEWLKKTLEQNPPQGCSVNFDVIDVGEGWNAPQSTNEMVRILQESSQKFFNKDASYCGEGGSIPFMKMLGDKYPKAQFAILGILGPNSNAHGPNEFLHIEMVKNLTCCVSEIVYQFNNHP